MKKKMTLWGITNRTDKHGKDVDATTADDDQIAFVVFACHEMFLSTL